MPRLVQAPLTALYRNSFITDWKITAENVAGLVAAGRARWKIENENNNVLKNHGYMDFMMRGLETGPYAVQKS